MNKLLRPSRLAHGAVSLAVLLLLAACGGGGGGGSGDDDPASPSTVSVSGVASKGLLKNAIVRALRVNADGSTTLLKESVTDTNGSYELTGIPAGTVVVVEISAGANTRMVDEASDNTDVPLPSNFRMRAAVVTQEGGANTVQVTPFSEMAVAKAQAASGGLTSANVEGANADIRQYLGFDVISEPPVFNDNGTTPANKAALMLAAISQVANDSAALSSLGCSGSDLGDKIKCVVDEMAARGSDDNTLAQTIDTAKDAVVNDDYVGTEVPAAPVPQPEVIVPPAQGATAVADAKALISALRGMANDVRAEGANTLKARVEAVESSFNAADEVLGNSQRGLLTAVVAAVNELDRVKRTGVASDFPEASYVYRPMVSGSYGAGCKFYEGGEGSTDEAESYADATRMICRVTHALANTPNGSFAVQHRFSVDLEGGEIGRYRVASQVIRQSITWSGGTWSSTGEAATPQSSQHSLQVALTHLDSVEPQLLAAVVAGDIAPAIHRDGTSDAGFATVGLTVKPSDDENVPEGATRLELEGSATAKLGGQSLNSLTLGEGSYIQARVGQVGNPSSPLVDDSQTAVRLVLESKTKEGALISGTLTIGQMKQDGAQVWIPTSAALTGTIKGADGQALFAGTVTATLGDVSGFDAALPSSPDNPVQKTVAFDGTLFTGTGLAPLEVDLELTDLNHGSYSLAGSVLRGTTKVMVSAAGQDSEGGLLATATFTSLSGVSLTVEPGQNVFPLLKSGVTVARIDDGIIYYRDNTRESF